jgi:hypothetical protein
MYFQASYAQLPPNVDRTTGTLGSQSIDQSNVKRAVTQTHLNNSQYLQYNSISGILRESPRWGVYLRKDNRQTGIVYGALPINFLTAVNRGS